LKRILRYLLPLTVLLIGAAGLVACGGGTSGESAGTDTDVDTLLAKTFKDKKEIKSGKLNLLVRGDVSGGSDSGTFQLRLYGPFESESKAKLPKFDLSLEASGRGRNIKAGVESTGDKGFVSFDGQDYSVPVNVFQQFKQGYEQAAQRGSKNGGQSLSSLGIDPRKWLENPKNAGEDKVGDADVIKITGGVDVGKLLDDINTLLAKAGRLGLQNQQLPSKLTQDQKAEVEKALKDVNVEIYTGKDDTILRRMKIDLNAQDPGGSGQTIALGVDMQLLDLGEGQSFEEPSDTKPLDQLLSKFGGLGALGGALGGSSGSGAAGSGSSSSAASQQKIKKYSDCLQAAGQDVSKAQKCASILTP
jgi:hypothetical protein